jgi:hypothetical protein
MGKLGTAEIPVQVDIGVGDAVTPEPESASFPTLLDFPAPRIRIYPAYTVVAEKFEAMVKLGMTNTRMKDFHDVWFLAKRFEFDNAILRQAIKATFARRKTPLPERPDPFSDAFATDAMKQTQWVAFLRRNGLTQVPGQFAEVIFGLRVFFEPLVYSLIQ